jgi:hypothetical protein
MRFTSLFNPSKLVKGVQFLARCLRRRSFLEHCLDQLPFIEGSLDQKTFVEKCLPQRSFLERCLTNRGIFELFLTTRQSLADLEIEEGSMFFKEELDLLQEAIQKANSLPGPIVEIGTLFGFTTTRMAIWKKPEKKILTVDNYCYNPWNLRSETHRDLTRHFLAYLIETGQVQLVEMDKNIFYRSYRGESPALVFLDAMHSYEETRADIEWAKRVGARIITGHDYSEGFPGVGKAVEEAGGVCAHAGSVWVLKTPYWESAGQATALGKCA